LLSLSACACMDIAFSNAGGIKISLTSTELTLIPHGSVRSSRTITLFFDT
jgi:hypothetical protein